MFREGETKVIATAGASCVEVGADAAVDVAAGVPGAGPVGPRFGSVTTAATAMTPALAADTAARAGVVERVGARDVEVAARRPALHALTNPATTIAAPAVTRPIRTGASFPSRAWSTS